ATLDAFDHHFTQRTIKVIFDGALGSRGAALLKPYSDAPATAGYLTEKPEDLTPMFEETLRRGIQVETHAIGDRANRTILDLYEKAFKAVPPEQRKIREPRKSIKGESGERWHPEQALSREDALKMFTLWPAYAAFEENDKGSIGPGKLADFTVLSQDIMKIPEPEILNTRCLMTVIGGEI